MPEDNKDQKSLAETEPKYRKQVHIFVAVVVGVLALSLILNTFRQSNRATEAIKNTPAPISKSEADFNKRLEEELAARQLKGSTETEAATMKSQNIGSAGYEDTVSPDLEFENEERKRALEARKSKFNIKKTKKDKLPTQTQPRRAIAENTLDKKRVLASERRRLEQQIAELNLHGNSSTGVFGSNKIINTDYDVKEAINAGQPKSVTEPKPGQKLIATGTILSAVLDQDLMSDYTGPVRMRLSQDVYDITDRYIIIPKGCTITGTSLHITNVNEPIQARMGIVVKWLVLPNGSRISFENGFALDQVGIAAIKDKVNRHLIAQFLGVAAYAVLSSETSRRGSGDAEDTTFAGDIGRSMRQQFAPLAAKYLSLVPTVTLRSGTPLKIFLEDDIYAYPWRKIDEKFLLSKIAAKPLP